MIKIIALALAVLGCAATLSAQSTSVTGQTQTQGQVQQTNLPPAPTCFICDCNNADFACRTACQSITDFTSRQQCEAACGKTQATCLYNAQLLQRASDTQRAAATQTTNTGRVN